MCWSEAFAHTTTRRPFQTEAGLASESCPSIQGDLHTAPADPHIGPTPLRSDKPVYATPLTPTRPVAPGLGVQFA